MSSSLQLRACADITSATVAWLWKPYVARGKIAMLDGDHGTGKSLVVADLAARLSRGEPLPGTDQRGEPITTLLLSAEHPAYVVRPRLEAAGADLARVVVAEWETDDRPQLPECASELKRSIQESGAGLLVIDPLWAFVPKALATSDHGIQHALAPLAAVAAETQCAVLLVRCPDRTVGPNAVYRGAGSVGALDMALTAMLVGGHPVEPETTVLAATKTYLGRCPSALGFTCAVGSTSPGVHWTGAADLRADELCIPRTVALVRGPRDRAAEFLLRALAAGPRPVEELERLAAEKGVSWRMVRRVKQSVHVVSERARGKASGWIWKISSPDPEQVPQEEPRDLFLRFAQAKGVDTRVLGDNPSLQDVIRLVVASVEPETVNGWMTELENLLAKNSSPSDALNGSSPVGRARTDQRGTPNRSEREGDGIAPVPSTSMPHPTRRQTAVGVHDHPEFNQTI